MLLSIITINLNNVTGLEKTIQSVDKQTFRDFEFVVIDGASTDGSHLVLEKYEAAIDNCISEKDSGIYNAMNKGIKVAKGQFLLFLNSGDVLTSSSALNDFITHTSFTGDIIYGDYKFQNGEKVYPDILPANYFMKTSLPHQSTFFKKEVFQQMGNYDEDYRISADRLFYIKCFENKSIEFKHVPYLLTLFDLSGLSNNASYLAQKKEEDERIFYSVYGTAYDDYKEELAKQAKLKRAKRNSFKGILKRIKNRIKKL